MGDAGVVGEGGCEGAALGFAVRSQEGVGECVVGGCEVVVALGMTDAVDCCFGHCCDCELGFGVWRW